MSPDAHGINGPSKPQTSALSANPSNSTVELKIAEVYRVIACRICDMSFSSLANRSRHEKLKHLLNFKELKCFACNKVWDHEDKLLDHYKTNHLEVIESNFIKPENKIIKNGYTYNTFEESQEYLKQFAENLILLRNRIPSAKQISLKSFTYYNQCIQKMIDRNSIDSNTSLKNIMDNLLSQNLIIKNSCHQCCLSFRGLSEFKQHISKRYCKKRVRLVESGQFQPNQHLKCIQCDRIFGCQILLTHHIKSEHCAVDVVPENCSKCLKSFQYRHEFNAHIQETCSYQIYCSICELLFETTDDFKLHTKVQHEIESKLNPKIWKIFNEKPRRLWQNKCCLCPKFYRNYQDLDKHFKNVHAEFELRTCEHCGDNFVQKDELRAHVNNFHFKDVKDIRDDAALMNGSSDLSGQLYLCVECNIVFNTNEDLEQHKTIHSNDFSDSTYTTIKEPLDSPLFTCDICVQTFNFEEELNQHKMTNHDDKRQIQFHCTMCTKTFNSNKSLVIHNIKAHSIKKKPSKKCSKCNKTFKNMRSIKVHLKRNNCIPTTKINKTKNNVKQTNTSTKTKLLEIKMEVEDNDESHECVVCKNVFPTKRSLICHAKMHYYRLHGPNCEVCGQRCESVESLLDHFKCHSSKALSNLNNMNSRQKIAEYEQQHQLREVDNNEHKCYVCQKIFTTKVGLNIHYSQKHRKTNKQHKSCVLCNESFDSMNSLISHVQDHVSKFDKFTCEICNELYLCDDYLVHMSKVHSTHACVFCNKTLFSFSNLMSHKNWHFCYNIMKKKK